MSTTEDKGAVSIPTYIYTDHLGSTQVTTDASSTLKETLDYYPYGATRLDQGSASTTRQYIGQYYDSRVVCKITLNDRANAIDSI